VFSILALKALAVYTILTPGFIKTQPRLPSMGSIRDTKSLASRGPDIGEIPVASRPAYGQSKDGRNNLKQVLRSLGVSGDGGLPLRLGIRDGHTRDSTENPVAIEECLAFGLEGVMGIVADSTA
jgi:transposase